MLCNKDIYFTLGLHLRENIKDILNLRLVCKDAKKGCDLIISLYGEEKVYVTHTYWEGWQIYKYSEGKPELYDSGFRLAVANDDFKDLCCFVMKGRDLLDLLSKKRNVCKLSQIECYWLSQLH